MREFEEGTILKEGKDYHFNVINCIGEGSFGLVYNSWMVTGKSEVEIVVKKVVT